MAETQYSRLGDRYHNSAFSFNSPSTAYTGADGHIDIDLEDENEDDFGASTPKTPRTALSTRLLSSLPSAQPAAAAALTRSKSILHSRAKSLAAWTSSFSSPIAERPTASGNKLFGDLFSGESAPVRLGVAAQSPIKEREESEFVMDYRPSFTSRPSLGSQRKSVVSIHSAAPSTTKQGWFSRKSIAPIVNTPAVNDELLTLNINNSLFPNGPVDPLSPSDFHDLLLNATKLLERMQNAYREKVEYISSIQPEIDAQREEVEEAETRAQHLKMQLEDMGRKAQEQEQAMSQLATQLTEEKLKAQEAGTTIRVVDEDNTPTRRRKRGSAGSASDSGFESDWDRESVASSAVPTPRTPPAVTAGSPFDQLDQRLHDRKLRLQRQAPLRAINLGYGRTDDNAVAWNTVQQLRSENQDLRQQVELMQESLQGCIELVNSVRI